MAPNPSLQEAKIEVVQATQTPDGETEQSSETTDIDPEVERQCMRKFDLFVMPQIFIILLLGYLDRSNIGTWQLEVCTATTMRNRYRTTSQQSPRSR